VFALDLNDSVDESFLVLSGSGKGVILASLFRHTGSSDRMDKKTPSSIRPLCQYVDQDNSECRVMCVTAIALDHFNHDRKSSKIEMDHDVSQHQNVSGDEVTFEKKKRKTIPLLMAHPKGFLVFGGLSNGKILVLHLSPQRGFVKICSLHYHRSSLLCFSITITHIHHSLFNQKQHKSDILVVTPCDAQKINTRPITKLNSRDVNCIHTTPMQTTRKDR
jgi:hypothetical protein